MHEDAFATIVLSGGYSEAGDTGCHRAKPGDVVLHAPYERHLDRVAGNGAEILVVPLSCMSIDHAFGQIADPDSLVRVLESDAPAAERLLFEQLVHRHEPLRDWPEDLARALRDDPSLNLGSWADSHGLSLGSISRGFSQVYDISPRSYRLLQRTHHAIKALLETDAALADIAMTAGFADHAHMSRAIRHVTSLSPSELRAHWQS
jgi:AraC-like DNA-binding protein